MEQLFAGQYGTEVSKEYIEQKKEADIQELAQTVTKVAAKTISKIQQQVLHQQLRR